LAPASVEPVVEACRSHAAAIAVSLNLCFDAAWTLEVGEALPHEAADWPAEFDGPGLALVFEAAGLHLLALLPESLPLPAWYLAPGEGESARLQTLALEWSAHLLPDDIEADACRGVTVDNLRQSTRAAGPDEEAVCLDLRLTDADGVPSRCRLIWPVSDPSAVQPLEIEKPPAQSADEPAAVSERPHRPGGHIPTRQILRLPVTVSVRLAERRIELKQLLGLAPGALLTFTKPCEDLLDLYVNNRPYCRGEAVKIGEKFGLKINTFEPKPHRGRNDEFRMSNSE
jgi:flagellar motor switch protein FliN/FliY